MNSRWETNYLGCSAVQAAWPPLQFGQICKEALRNAEQMVGVAGFEPATPSPPD
jgi:hypothetical protein